MYENYKLFKKLSDESRNCSVQKIKVLLHHGTKMRKKEEKNMNRNQTSKILMKDEKVL